MALETFDVTARKAHQAAMLALVVSGFLLGEPKGAVPLAVAGGIMLAGRYWWPADVVRQLTWRVLEPRGILKRRERVEDHQTRRVARVIGGAAWLGAAGLLLLGAPLAAWGIAFLIAAMVALDAAFDFCALCFVTGQLDRRGWTGS